MSRLVVQITNKLDGVFSEYGVQNHYFAFRDPDSGKVQMKRTNGTEWAYGSILTFKKLLEAEIRVELRRATGMDI